MSKDFELFLGCLGNGLTICNKAVTVNGDYKKIAHIGKTGNIKLYVPESSIPEDAVVIIRRESENMREKFIQYWNGCTTSYKCLTILNSLPVNERIEVIKEKKPMEIMVKEMTQYYIDTY